MRSMFSPALTCAVAVLALFSPAAATTTSCRSDSDCPAYTGTIPNTSQTYCSAATNSCRLAIGAFQACSALDFNPCVPGLLCRPPETSDSPWTCQSKPSPASAFPPRSTTTVWAMPTGNSNGMWNPSQTTGSSSDVGFISPGFAVFFILASFAFCCIILRQGTSKTPTATATAIPAPRDPDVVVESVRAPSSSKFIESGWLTFARIFPQIDAPPAYSTAPRGGEVVAASTPIRSPLATGAGDIPLAVLPSAPPAPTSMAPPELAPSNSR
ncbi:hypothetical protein BC828DRAFT_399042 [Blastocladiella britannica]|nr:hypothetical protein BC828DRAFT_399042 [Blastocladiella britannica]